MTATIISNLDCVPSNTNIGVLHHPNMNNIAKAPVGLN